MSHGVIFLFCSVHLQSDQCGDIQWKFDFVSVTPSENGQALQSPGVVPASATTSNSYRRPTSAGTGSAATRIFGKDPPTKVGSMPTKRTSVAGGEYMACFGFLRYHCFHSTSPTSQFPGDQHQRFPLSTKRVWPRERHMNKLDMNHVHAGCSCWRKVGVFL